MIDEFQKNDDLIIIKITGFAGNSMGIYFPDIIYAKKGNQAIEKLTEIISNLNEMQKLVKSKLPEKVYNKYLK